MFRYFYVIKTFVFGISFCYLLMLKQLKQQVYIKMKFSEDVRMWDPILKVIPKFVQYKIAHISHY